MGARRDIDWEWIEREYRLGQKTLRQMAKEFNVQASAISRKAKKEGWTQDKSSLVKNLSNVQLLSVDPALSTKATESATSATELATPTDYDVLVAATARTNVILSHRGVSVRLRTVGMAMLDELEHQTLNQPLYEKLEELMIDPEDKGAEKLKAAFRRAMELPTRISNFKSLAEGMKTGIAIERQAFNIDDGQGTDDESKVIKRIERVIVDVTPK